MLTPTCSRPEVSKVMGWAENQEQPIKAQRGNIVGSEIGVAIDIFQASAALFAGLAHEIAPGGLDSRCRFAGENRCLELRRIPVQENGSKSVPMLLRKQVRGEPEAIDES